jgi:glycosyltransferase involved in cell wall biosynthesis
MISGRPSLRIALICDWFHPRVGGIETHLMALVAELIQAGHSPHIITATPGPVTGYAFPVHRLTAPITRRFGLVHTLGPFREIHALLRQHEFDVVHCHSSILSPLAYGSLFLAKRQGYPAIMTCHSVIRYYSVLFKLADHLLGWSRWPVLFSAVSPTAAHFLKNAGRMATVHILPNAVDSACWQRPDAAKEPGEINLVSVMRLSIRKRTHVLIRLMPEILKRCPSGLRVRLTIIGDGTQKSSLEKLVHRLDLEESVKFLGVLDQEAIADIFALSDIFVLPSKLEAFGLAALEARSAGLPIIGMRHSGLRHLVSHGEDGLLAGNDEELKEHILNLINDSELRLRITRHNRTSRVPWTWETLSSMTLHCRKEICAAGSITVK